MKKLIALFATTAVASGSAMGAIALSGSASVSYDDNGSAQLLQLRMMLTYYYWYCWCNYFHSSMDIDGATVQLTAATMQLLLVL